MSADFDETTTLSQRVYRMVSPSLVSKDNSDRLSSQDLIIGHSAGYTCHVTLLRQLETVYSRGHSFIISFNDYNANDLIVGTF